MADLRIVDAPVILQESITDDVKMPTGGLGNYAIRLGDLVWYVVTKEQLANKNYVDLSSKGVKDSLDEHIADKANPHQVTKAQVGLGNVDNTADVDKPVSNATESAIITATTDMATKTYVDSKDGDLTTLSTTDKTNLVKAINEIHDVTKGVVALYDRNVEAGGDENGWIANFIADESGMTQQQVNDKTALFYNTVADMVADTKLKAGKAVITHGYYTPNDGGGTRYLIKDTATDYSIPLINGSHAVFNDTFDIRKFGIVDDPTFSIVQDSNLTRMCRYADKYSYVVDFHNFSIKTPQTLFYPTGRGLQHRGIGFHKVHEIKNLKMSHNVGTLSQFDGLTHLLVKFLSYDDIEGVLKFSNITLDGYIQNYSPTIGESDGGFNGIVVETHNLENTLWNQSNHREFPLDIIFENINFIRPCMSYGISASMFKSRSITGRGIRGEIVALAACVYAEDIKFDDVDILYRNDLHTPGRELVRSAIHIEPEMGPEGTSDIDTIKLSNINIKDTAGEYGLGFFMYVRGKININEISFTDFESNVLLDSMPSKGSLIKKCTIKNAKRLNIISKIDNLTIDNCLMQYWNLKDIDNQTVKEANPLAYLIFKTLEISRCSIIGSPLPTYQTYFEGDKLILNDCFIRGYGTTSIFKTNGKVTDIEINKGRFQMESAAIYEGLNDVITVNDSKFLDVSTGFTKVTNPDVNTGRLELNNVYSDGVITDMVAADRRNRIIINNIRFPNLLSLSFPIQCRMLGSGINSFGYQVIMPTPFVVAAKQVKTWKIDLPHFAAKGDFRVSFFNENSCMITVSNPADLSNFNQIKVHVFNPTDIAIDLSGVYYYLEFTSISM